MKLKRNQTRTIQLGNIKLGSKYPVRIQSMTNTYTWDIERTLAQIEGLAKAGCEIIRVAVPDQKALDTLDQITQQSPMPVIADIHFDHRLALGSIEKGVKGLRINPGNIKGKDRFLEVISELAKHDDVALRIGVNAGSLEKELRTDYEAGKMSLAQAMVQSALKYIEWVEDTGFSNVKISLKASDVWESVEAYSSFAAQSDYPLHIGITEAGPLVRGSIKSSVGLGILLFQGIGDTMRVSLSEKPVEEVKVAYEILRALKLRERGVDLISCPTCGRTEIDLISLVEQVEKVIEPIEKPIKVAVMGCIVNGPGEARDADIGICGGKNCGLIIRKGEIIKKVEYDQLLPELKKELDKLLAEG